MDSGIRARVPTNRRRRGRGPVPVAPARTRTTPRWRIQELSGTGTSASYASRKSCVKWESVLNRCSPKRAIGTAGVQEFITTADIWSFSCERRTARDCLGDAACFKLARQNLHRDAGKDVSIRPDHGASVPERQVPDRRLAEPPGVVFEGSVVEPASVGAPEIEGLGYLTDVLDLRQMPLVPNHVQGQWPGWRCHRVGDLDQDIKAEIWAARHELSRAGGEVAGHGYIRRCGIERHTKLLADLHV